MRAYIALFMALLIGYSTYWSAYYVKLFHGDDLTIVGTLKDYEFKCTSAGSSESYCTNAYRIPNHIIKNSEWLGAGVIISASKYYCAETPNKSINFDDPLSPGKRFELFHTYQSINLNHFNCPGDLIVEAWSRKNATRIGYQEGSLVVGKYSAVERLKSFYQLLIKDLSRLFSILFLCLFFIYSVMKKLFKRSVNDEPFVQYLAFWCLFSFSASDLVQIIIPLTKYPLLTNRISAFFSLTSHIMPLVFAISTSSYRIHKPFIGLFNLLCKKVPFFPYPNIIHVFFLIICLLPSFATPFVACLLTAAFVGFIFSLFEKNTALTLFCFLITICALNVLNFSWMPNSLTASYYVAFYILLDFKDRLVTISRLSEKIIGIGHLAEELNSSITEKIETEIVELLESNQVTFLHLSENGGCQIRQHKKSSNSNRINVFERETLPPLFAYIVSNQETLWNIQDSTDLVKQIMTKKENHRDYVSNYFCALPINYGGQVIGAIAFTEYDVKRFQLSSSNEIKNYLDIALRSYSEYLIKEKMLKDKGFISVSKRLNEVINTSFNKASDTSSSESIENIFHTNLKKINKELDTFGFIGTLDKETRKFTIISIDGYNEEIKSRYLNGSIYALEENRHGPLPLAINGQKIITIPDVELWKDVFHEYTNYFFRVSKTKSCVAIPIFSDNINLTGLEKKNNVWGAIFLEKSTLPPLTSRMNEIFHEISSSLSDLVSNINHKKELNVTINTLSEFIPKDSIEMILKDNRYEETDEGYIVMIDLAGSTKVVSHYGKHAWEAANIEIKEKLNRAASKYNLVLRDFKWDAYHFTLSTLNQTNNKLNQIIQFITDSKVIIDDTYKNSFPNLYEYKIAETPKARICICYGDISRGINQGATKTWTFTGVEMANVTKLEGLCKDLQQSNPYTVIFCDESVEPSLNIDQWKFADAIVTSNNRKIFYYLKSWSDLGIQLKKAA